MEGVEVMDAFSKVKPNECLHCDGRLILIEAESSINKLDQYGRIIYTKEEGYEVYLMCSKCGALYEADKRGDRWFIAEDPLIKSIAQNKMPIDFNPFLDR